MNGDAAGLWHEEPRCHGHFLFSITRRLEPETRRRADDTDAGPLLCNGGTTSPHVTQQQWRRPTWDRITCRWIILQQGRGARAGLDHGHRLLISTELHQHVKHGEQHKHTKPRPMSAEQRAQLHSHPRLWTTVKLPTTHRSTSG